MQNIRKHIVFSLLFFSCLILSAQEFNTKIEGQVYSKDGDVAAVHVSNITKNRGTITDINGFFNISVGLNDTLVFSAVQFKKKKVIVTFEILKSETLNVTLEDALTQLNEVVVTPYSLTGDLNRDAKRLKLESVVTASTLDFPNAHIKIKTQNERKLLESKDGAYIKPMNTIIPWFNGVDIDIPAGIAINVKRILNDLSGRTKMLKNRIKIDENAATLNNVKRIYNDSIYEQELKIPKENINDFINFCEVDSLYSEVVESNDILRLWEFLERNSFIYRKNNKLD